MTAPPRTRQSNFELLRITAMLLVLAVHADFLALGIPKADALAAQPLQTWTRIIIESLALVCVNTFVMISGWFGIRPTLRGAAALIFQCIFFAVLMHIADAAIFGKPISLDYIIKALTLQHAGWFVTSYLILYALSPVLNAFTEHTPARRGALVTLLLLAAGLLSASGQALGHAWPRLCAARLALVPPALLLSGAMLLLAAFGPTPVLAAAPFMTLLALPLLMKPGDTRAKRRRESEG